MILMDVNVLVYAHREDVKDHQAYRDWLESVVNSESAYGYSERVLSGFLRVVTHSKVFEQPSSMGVALASAEQIRTAPQAVCLAPGNNHWKLSVRCMKHMGSLISRLFASSNISPSAFYKRFSVNGMQQPWRLPMTPPGFSSDMACMILC